MDEPFKNINEHWAHFLERDMPTNAPFEQVHEMKRAFAAGAISGVQLAILGRSKETIMLHVEDIKRLAKP